MYHLIGFLVCIFKKVNLKLFLTDYINALYILFGIYSGLESNAFFFFLKFMLGLAFDSYFKSDL